MPPENGQAHQGQLFLIHYAKILHTLGEYQGSGIGWGSSEGLRQRKMIRLWVTAGGFCIIGEKQLFAGRE